MNFDLVGSNGAAKQVIRDPPPAPRLAPVPFLFESVPEFELPPVMPRVQCLRPSVTPFDIASLPVIELPPAAHVELIVEVPRTPPPAPRLAPVLLLLEAVP